MGDKERNVFRGQMLHTGLGKYNAWLCQGEKRKIRGEKGAPVFKSPGSHFSQRGRVLKQCGSGEVEGQSLFAADHRGADGGKSTDPCCLEDRVYKDVICMTVIAQRRESTVIWRKSFVYYCVTQGSL